MEQTLSLKLGMLVCVGIMMPLGMAYGHGFGTDTFSASLPDGDITVTVELPSEFESRGSKQLTITATYDDTGMTVPDITYLVELSHAGVPLLADYFFAPDGILAIDTEYAGGDIRDCRPADGGRSAHGTGPSPSPLVITGPVFGSGGLYTFEIRVMAGGQAAMPDEIHYADLTLVDTTEFLRTDSQDQPVKFRLKSYFDGITSFDYDPAKKELSFEMPFDWREKRMSHVPVVHEEVHFPKDFAEFLYPSYVGRVNGIELFRASVTVDDYTEDHERIVHFVLLQDHIRLLKNQLKSENGGLADSMTFTLSASEEIQFPLTAFTRSEDFQVDLSWIR